MYKNSYFSRDQIFFLIVTLLCLLVIYDYILYLAIGITLAYLFEPITEKMTIMAPIKKIWTKWVIAIITIIIMFIAVLAPITSLVTTGIEELIGVLKMLDTSLKTPHFFDLFAENISLFLKKFGIIYSMQEVLTKGIELLKSSTYLLASFLGIAISGTPSFLIKGTISILTWCLFIVHGKAYREMFLPKMIPWTRERNILSETVSSVLKALIVANVLVSCIQAIFITLTLGLFGLPRYALMGMIAFFLSFIPFIGTLPVMLGAALWLYFNEGRMGSAIGIMICALLIAVTDNILRPFFMKGGVKLSFFWIFLAIIGGISQFGLAGAVLGPVCFALFTAAIKMLESQKVVEEEK